VEQALPPHHAATQSRARAGARLALRGVVLNAVLAGVKFGGGILGRTPALIADGTESLLDVVTSVLVWAGIRVAGRPPDEDHPFGHGRAEPIAAFVGAGIVFVAAALVAAHAVHEIVHPQGKPHWATLLLLGAIIGLKIRLWLVVRKGEAEVSSTALGVEAWHHWWDAITSAAAFIGISLALLGAVGADSWAALFACLVVALNGISMLQRTAGEMMDSAAPQAVIDEVRTLAAAVPGVQALDKCRVRKSGLSRLVDIQVRVDGRLTVREGHGIAHAVKDALLGSRLGITDVSVHVEPLEGLGASALPDGQGRG
jgi:cation diffusion facilitator family transporter